MQLKLVNEATGSHKEFFNLSGKTKK